MAGIILKSRNLNIIYMICINAWRNPWYHGLYKIWCLIENYLTTFSRKLFQEFSQKYFSVQFCCPSVVYKIDRFDLMSKSVEWNQLQSASNLKTAWSIASNELGRFISSAEGLGEEVIAVPRLEEAAFYDLMVCFSKFKAHRFVLPFSKDYDFHLHGHMTDILGELADHKKLLECCKNPSNGDLNKENLTFSVHNKGGEKEVTITLDGLKKKVVNWAGISSGQLILDTEKVDLEGRRILYIITEVIYANKVSVSSKVGSDVKEEAMSTSGVPVAFAYTKFPVDKEGIIKEARNTTLNRSRTFAPV